MSNFKIMAAKPFFIPDKCDTPNNLEVKLSRNSITNNEELFLDMLADKCCREIMALASIKECSAMQLSGELDIPLTTVYRKLKLLEDAELIQNVKTLIDHSGNQEKYYRSTIRKAEVSFSEGKILIRLKKEDYKDNFVTLWKKISKPED